MENKDQCAFPINQIISDSDGNRMGEVSHAGLSKRELIAAMCLQGWVSSHTGGTLHPESEARQAVLLADALLAELAKEGMKE